MAVPFPLASCFVRYILGSRSPRRRELLQQIVPATAIDVVPPLSAEEAGFDGLTAWPAIRERLLSITRHKSMQVANQLDPVQTADAVLISADTSIIVSTAAHSPIDHGPNDDELDWPMPLMVIGQPPDDEPRSATLRRWFRDHYAGRTHIVATALRVMTNEHIGERVVTTRVTFRRDVEPWLDWYLATGESRGKAGGYAIQGAGSVFVTRIEGSLSNVIGLPLEALLDLLWQFDALPP